VASQKFRASAFSIPHIKDKREKFKAETLKIKISCPEGAVFRYLSFEAWASLE
jgi:hypothetical protein